MPIPIALSPVAGMLARYVILLAIARFLSRHHTERLDDVAAEHALDRLDEGVHMHRNESADGYAYQGSGRIRRVLSPVASRFGVEVDFAAIGRLRIRKIHTDDQPASRRRPHNPAAGEAEAPRFG